MSTLFLRGRVWTQEHLAYLLRRVHELIPLRNARPEQDREHRVKYHHVRQRVEQHEEQRHGPHPPQRRHPAHPDVSRDLVQQTHHLRHHQLHHVLPEHQAREHQRAEDAD